MNSNPAAVVRVLLFACAPLIAAASAQEKPATGSPAPALAPLATSTQGQARARVDIVIALRHAPAPDARCDGGASACDVAGHWLIELQAAGAKPVLLTLEQQAELQKELKSAASPKARKVAAVTRSDATLSLRVPPNAPYACVQSLLTTVALSGIHQTEFAVASADQGEQRLAVPLPISTGAEIEEDTAPHAIQEVRIALYWDQARSDLTRVFGKNSMPKGAEGDARLLMCIKDCMEGWRKLGKPDTPGCIDAARAVPWEAVVQTIDAFRAAGVQNIQFSSGKPRK